MCECAFSVSNISLVVHLYPVSHPDLLECEDMSDPDNPQNLELKGKKNQEIKVNHRIFR